jgi:Transposase DDE domain
MPEVLSGRYICWSLRSYHSVYTFLKLHTVLDYDTGLPCYAVLSEAKEHDVKATKTIDFPNGSVFVMDRAYVDLIWLNNLDSSGVFFVTKLKIYVKYEIIETFVTNEKHDHVLKDEDIRLTELFSDLKYPKNRPFVKVYNPGNDQELLLLTNNMSLTAETISQQYKSRLANEIFFKH